MESSKIIFLILLVLPTVLSQTTGMTTIENTDLQTTAGLPTGDSTTLGEAVTTQPEMSAAPTTSSGEAGAPTTQAKTEAPGPDETQAPTTQGKTAAPGPDETQAPTTEGKTEAVVPNQTQGPTTAGETEAVNPDRTQGPTTAAETEAVNPDRTQGPTTAAETEAVNPDRTQGPTTAGETDAVDPDQTDAPTTLEQTEDPEQTTSEVAATTAEPEEVILSVTTAVVSYPDDQILTVGGGALVTITATVKIINGSVDFIDDLKVIVFAADSQMEELSTGIEVSLEPYNLTINQSQSFNKLNATLTLDNVECTDFTQVCVRVEPSSNAVWKISAEGSTDRSCDEISCKSGTTRLVVSGLLMALCLFISRLSSDHGD